MAKRTKSQAKLSESGLFGGRFFVNWGPGWIKISAWVFGGLGLGAAWVMGVPRLEAYAELAGSGAASEEVKVRFLEKPAWVTEELRDHLAAQVQHQLSGNLLARDDLLRAKRVLEESGWIEEVQQVRRVGEDKVEIWARFVTPFAVIRDGEGDHLVDGKGKLLPLTIPAGAKHNLIAITNVHFSRPLRAGLWWEGTDITAGLAVLRLIADEPWRAKGQVAAIDLGGFMETGMVTLVSDRGCRLVWGSGPGEERALESRAERKLSYLKYHYENFGHIDLGHTGEIDLTGKDQVVKR